MSGFSRGTSLPLSILRTGRLVEAACFLSLTKLIQSSRQVDYASYDWVKLDPSLPATRDVVNQYWRLYQMIKKRVLTENKYEVFLLREGLKKVEIFHDFCN